MSAISAYTLAEARDMLEKWKECERELASGQSKRYRIGSREFEAVDLPEVASRITYFANLVEALSGKVRTKRVVCVVPRDL